MLPATGGGCSTHGPPHYVRKPLGSPFRCFLLTGQGLFNPVTCRTADSSQGGSFSRCNGGRYECQEWKESTSLTSLFATDTTHGPSPSSTFGRHEVFETMKGTRCRHVHLGFSSVPRRRRRRFVRRCPPSPPPPPPDFGGQERDIDHRVFVISIPPTPGYTIVKTSHMMVDVLSSSVGIRIHYVVGQRL